MSIHTHLALVELALGNSLRTPSQQQHLVAECRTLDNVFVDWSAEAHRSWLAKPCEVCDEAIEVTDGPLCDKCVAYERAHGIDLPGLCER